MQNAVVNIYTKLQVIIKFCLFMDRQIYYENVAWQFRKSLQMHIFTHFWTISWRDEAEAASFVVVICVLIS